MSSAVPRPALVAIGPVIGAITVVAALQGTGASLWYAVPLALVCAGGLAAAGDRGGDVALAVGLGAIAVAAGASLAAGVTAAGTVLWTAGAVAAGEATGLAKRTRSIAAADPVVVTAELTWSAVVVVATLVGGFVLLGAGELPGPGGLVGEVLALGALVGLGALLLTTPPARAALRSLLQKRDP